MSIPKNSIKDSFWGACAGGSGHATSLVFEDTVQSKPEEPAIK